MSPPMSFLPTKRQVRTLNQYNHLAHQELIQCASIARLDGSNAPDAQMPPPGVPDSNDEDSDDDMYGPYPPYNTRPPAESDRSDGQIDEGLLFL
jgi:hypothetical protein